MILSRFLLFFVMIYDVKERLINSEKAEAQRLLLSLNSLSFARACVKCVTARLLVPYIFKPSIMASLLPEPVMTIVFILFSPNVRIGRLHKYGKSYSFPSFSTRISSMAAICSRVMPAYCIRKACAFSCRVIPGRSMKLFRNA